LFQKRFSVDHGIAENSLIQGLSDTLTDLSSNIV